ncbi:ABC transporter ATP-binding protein [Pseudoxanthomonas sp. z9]|uniref:ABC transporter ATP-binding protein n=1 Tax=Pseudoxanthomonas sp. z9 TaxID=2584942 RepID=UPI0011411872|nr:ABC transporter ATP-binding protein [Pseudoxanthomonas sp. z9]
MQHAIEVEQVDKRFGALQAVDGVSLSIPAGTTFGLVGHNGAGKSTLFKMMLGIEPASAGQIRIHGTPVRGAAFRWLRQRIGYLPENVALYDNLSGLDTLRFFARLKAADTRQCTGLLEQVGLTQAMKRPVREYSKGMRQRLGFAQALLGQPELLFLDEPTNGLDPQAIHDFYDTLATLKRAGATIVLSSHLLAEIQPHLDSLVILANGRAVAQGSVDSLTAASDLPSRARLHARDADAARRLGQRLGDAGFPVIATADNVLTISVARAHRTGLLPLLAEAGPALVDVEIHPPTLEDLYLRQRHAGGHA